MTDTIKDATMVAASSSNGKVHEKDQSDDDKNKKKELPTFILPQCIVDFLNRSPNKKFETDFEYFQALLAVESAR